MERMDCNKIIRDPARGFTVFDHRLGTIFSDVVLEKVTVRLKPRMGKRSTESERKENFFGFTGC